MPTLLVVLDTVQLEMHPQQTLELQEMPPPFSSSDAASGFGFSLFKGVFLGGMVEGEGLKDGFGVWELGV